MDFDRILIDGNFFARKFFEVNKGLTAKVDGKLYYSGLTHGFLMKLVQLKRDYDGQVIVVWDAGIKRRRIISRDYKLARRESGKEWKDKKAFFESKHQLVKFLNLIGVYQARKPGDEGDDVLYTLAKRMDGNSLIVSNDHDMYQAISPSVYQLITKRGEDKLMSAVRFERLHGVTPQQYTFAMALAGCSGDGVKGIPGVGMKTAIKFIQTWPQFVPTLLAFNTEENIVDWYPMVDEKNVVLETTKYFDGGERGPPKLLRRCVEQSDMVLLTYRLIKLYDCWPVVFNRPRPDHDRLEIELDRFHFHELARRVDELVNLCQ